MYTITLERLSTPYKYGIIAKCYKFRHPTKCHNNENFKIFQRKSLKEKYAFKN